MRQGRALHDDRGDVTIFKSALNGNYSRDGDGGAIHLGDCGCVNIEESSLKENKSEKDGGAIFNMDSNLSIKNSILDENMVDWNGGAIYNLRSSLSVHESTLTKNVAKEGGGGAIYNREAEFTITDSIFNENIAKFNEKATDWNGVVIHISDEFTKQEWVFDRIRF
jgi:hypothetical protein